MGWQETVQALTDWENVKTLSPYRQGARRWARALTEALMGEIPLPPPPPPTPVPTTRTTFGVFKNNDGGNPLDPPSAQNAVDQYEINLGSPVLVAHQFMQPYSIGNGEQSWAGPWVEAMVRRWATWKNAKPGRRVLFTISPGFSTLVGTEMDRAAYESVVNGSRDTNIRSMASLLVSAGLGDSIVRTFHENGFRFTTMQRSDPSLAATAHRRVVDICRSVPGANFTFMWFFAGSGTDVVDANGQKVTAERAWPGAGYVDYVYVDYYCDNTGLSLLKADYAELAAFCQARSVKMALGEYGPWHPDRISETNALAFYQWLFAQPWDLAVAFDAVAGPVANHVLTQWPPVWTWFRAKVKALTGG